MKKLFPISVCAAILLNIVGVTAAAETEQAASTDVYVTVSDDTGALVLSAETITVTDRNNDGKLDIDETLYATHEAKFDGGADKGYGSDIGDYGLYLTKLWGIESGVSYGYYVNNVSTMGLSDEVKQGDYVNAFVYTDLTSWSDTYCYFDKNTISASEGESVTVTLSAAGYDADWNPITVPVEGATVTLNGNATDAKTDAEGKATVEMTEAGSFVISAVSDTQTLVPPVCIAVIEEKSDAPAADTGSNENENPDTGIRTDCAVIVFAASAAALAVCVKRNRSKADEK